MATGIDDDDDGFFIPLAEGETEADRLDQIRRDELERTTVDPAHANMRGYVWTHDPPYSGVALQRHCFRIIGANGMEYTAVADGADAEAGKAKCSLGALVTFSASNRRIVLETHAAIQPDRAVIVDYDLGKRAWVAEDKANGRRFCFTTKMGDRYVHGFNGTPSLGATVSYHADKQGEPYGVMMQQVPRPIAAWRNVAFHAGTAVLIPQLLLSAGLQIVGAPKLANAVLGGNKPVTALPPVKFPSV